MMLTARSVDARQALDWGLANVVAEEGRLMDAALEMAERIAALPPNALRGTKRLLRKVDDCSFDQGLAEADRIQEALHHQPDPLEAITTVLEKRRGERTEEGRVGEVGVSRCRSRRGTN